MEPVDYMSFNFITNQDEVYYSFHISNKSLYSRLSVTSSGLLQRFAWVPETQQWSQFCNGGSGCVFWTGELFDMRQYPGGGQDLYVRLAASDIGDGGSAGTIIIGIAVGIGILILALSGFSIWKRKRLLSVLKIEAKISC
uniref:Brassica self-incompatibility locus family protein n=1 Tax=Populus alba TaxID=43335 RepID=A0A4U5MAZ0_POPAL|nr:Brassica self-incompatibility locus family protein [Populus alba]